jgi:CubicO group peptidase (beta-lactamase class C family)
LQSRVDAGDFPSAVYLAAEKGEVKFEDALGYAVVEPERIEARVDTIYDLASVTKVLVTALLAAKLIEDGRLRLDAPISQYLDSHELGDKASISIKQLFTHSTDLPGWIPFYLQVAERTEILFEIVRTPFNADRGLVVYGDPNFWLITFILERIFGEPIDVTARRLIIEPLGLKDTFFTPPDALKRRVAASEKGTNFERQLCRDLGYDFTINRITGEVPFRDDVIWNEVHDQNAYFFGSVGGHAGLFSTAADVLTMAKQFLPNSTRLLKPETCELFTTNLTAGRNEDRSFGFELASSPDSTAGSKMSPQSFGHLGFTGTSLWIDPVKERVFILLTNRTHDHDLPLVNMNPIRRQFHNLAIDALDADL